MSHQLIKNFKALFVAVSCALLAACGGGGGGGSDEGGGSEPVTQTPSVGFTVTGTWRAMSMGGFYPVQIDEVAGTLSYNMPDEITGVARSVSLAGMSRGGDGAYVFHSGLSAQGMALDAKFYRVDDTTMAGAILSSLNGVMKLTPVILTKNWATDFSRLTGDWNGTWFECAYSHQTQRCEQAVVRGELVPYQGHRAAGRFDGLKEIWCEMLLDSMRVSQCQSDKLASQMASDLGEGFFGGDGFAANLFSVAGEDLIFGRGHSPDSDTTYAWTHFAVRDTKHAATAFNGTWRAVTEDGRTGVVRIDGESFVADIAGRMQAVGVLRRNAPWNGMSRLDVDGARYPYYMTGTQRVAYVSGNEGLYVLFRDEAGAEVFHESGPKSSLSGTWRAMSSGGIQEVAVDEDAGTVHYNMIDIVTGTTRAAKLSQLRHGLDGAYIFSLEESPYIFSEGGRLYRLDEDTLTGRIPALMNGRPMLMPVIISRKLITDPAQLNGQWNYSFFECAYDLTARQCQNSNPNYDYSGGRGAIGLNQLVSTECADMNTPIWACPADQIRTAPVNSLGSDIYGLGQNQVLGFWVRGTPFIFGQSRRAEANKVLISARLYAPRTKLTEADWSGTWRIEAFDGRTGIGLIDGHRFLAYMDESGSFGRIGARNLPWDGMVNIEVHNTTSSAVNVTVGNSDLLFAGGDEGFYLFHRAQ